MIIFRSGICNRLFMMDFISSMFCHEEKTTYSSYLLPSSSLFCLPHDSPVSLTDEVQRQGITTLFGKLADWEEGKLMSQNNNLIGVWMPGKEVNSKGHLSWKLERDVFISSFLQPFTSGQGQTVSLWAEKSHFSLTFRQRSRIPQQKQWVAKAKVKEIQQAVKTGSSCYSSSDLHLHCLGPVSCAFSSWVSTGCTTLAGVSAESWWLQHPLFTDVTGGIFSSHQISTRN